MERPILHYSIGRIEIADRNQKNLKSAVVSPVEINPRSVQVYHTLTLKGQNFDFSHHSKFNVFPTWYYDVEKTIR